jgi:tRNA pseudouridine38-40 synthase
VIDVATVPDDFHARFSATGKTYEYRIWNGARCRRSAPLRVARAAAARRGAMQQRGRAIPGEHDFAAFQGARA